MHASSVPSMHASSGADHAVRHCRDGDGDGESERASETEGEGRLAKQTG